MVAAKNNFLDHVKWLRAAAQAQGADLLIEGEQMRALLRRGERHLVLLPRFLAEVDGASQYVDAWTNSVTHFAGWLPYSVKRWPISTDKLVFKRYAQSVGMRVPSFSVAPDAVLENVIVKRAVSSFGAQVRGPYRSASEASLDVAQGDYFESYVQGEHLKVWYWNGEPVAMEVDRPPAIVGDGVWTFGERIAQRIGAYPGQDGAWLDDLLSRCETFLRFHGTDLNAVLPRGKRHAVEFRYGTRLMLAIDRRVVRFGDEGEAAPKELVEAGAHLWRAVGEVERPQTLFAVDAVRDREGRIWFLEVNSHPTVHPLAYPAMLKSLLSAPVSAAPSARNAALDAEPAVLADA